MRVAALPLYPRPVRMSLSNWKVVSATANIWEEGGLEEPTDSSPPPDIH